jgi:exodeoxyribonuclease X
MVRFAKSADEARQIVATGADYLCAHNAAFDSRFVRDHGLPWICTLKAARAIWPDLQGHGNGAIRYERRLCPHDDRALPSHRAGPDTWVTAHILLDLLREVSVDRLIAITENPVLLRKVDFGEHSGKPWSEVPDKYLHWILHTSNMPSDPKKEDVVFTARCEVKRRSAPTVEKPKEQDAAFDFGKLDRPRQAEKKGGAKAQRAAIICGVRSFWVFLDERHDVQVDSAEAAADWLREKCGVTSRADLDHEPSAGAAFSDLDHRYRLWLDGFD